jgi:hypothetical protein
MALDEVMPEARQTVIGKRAGGEIMSEDKEQKIEVNLEELRYWKVKDYDEAFCRAALYQMIIKYFNYKRDAENYKKYYQSAWDEVNMILRHLKLCQNCFRNHDKKDWNKITYKYVKGTYDRGIHTDKEGKVWDSGFVCAKHKAQDEALTKQFGPIINKVFSKMLEKKKEK